MWDLSSPTRDWTLVPWVTRQILNHQTTGGPWTAHFKWVNFLVCELYLTLNLFIYYLFIYGCAGSPLLLGFSLVSGSGGYSLLVVHGLHVEVASLVADHGLQSTGSALVVHRLSCSKACGIFLDQGSNPWLLYSQVILYHLATREACISLLKIKKKCPQKDLYTNVHSSLICNSPKLETSKYPSTGEWIKKLLYSCNGLLLDNQWNLQQHGWISE